MRHIVCICPQLLPDRAVPDEILIDHINPIWPTFAALINQGERIWPTASSLEKLLFEQFGLPALGELPAAALSGLADQLPVQQGWWLRADPVALQADAQTAFMQDCTTLALTKKESTSLFESLQTYFQEHQLQLHQPHEARWYLSSATTHALQTYAPSDVSAQSIVHFMPFGDQGQWFRQIFNDVQMLLHRHPVNLKRAELGQATIAGLWFWGSGVLPSLNSASVTKVWSDDALAKGLAQHMQVDVAASPECASDVFAEIAQGAVDARYILHIANANTGDVYAQQALEQTLFAPMKAALHAKQCDKITFIINSHFAFEFTKPTAWKQMKHIWNALWTPTSKSET